MTAAADPLDALFKLSLGAAVRVKRQSDGETLVVHVAARGVTQDADGTRRWYTLAGHGGAVSYPAGQIERLA